MRAPSFKGLREDKPAAEVIREEPSGTTEPTEPSGTTGIGGETSAAPQTLRDTTDGATGVRGQPRRAV